MEIQYEKAAVKYLKGLQKPQRDLILDAIEKLTHKPAEGDIKKMSGYKDGRYRLRVGKYRISLFIINLPQKYLYHMNY